MYPYKKIIAQNTVLALFAAVLFGSSIPFSKVLIGEIHPVLLAALLYLGSGLTLGLFLKIRLWLRGVKNAAQGEAKLNSSDLPWLLGSVFCGGVIAPIALMFGLSLTQAAVASLFLNLEGILTILWAGLLFKEAIGSRVWIAVILLFIGAVILSLPRETLSLSSFIGPSLIILASAMWGLDNNLTRHLSGKDPLVISFWKGIGAGVTNLLLSLFWNVQFPVFSGVVSSLFLGAVCFGISLVCFIYALRHLGASRAGVFFGTAPFWGAGLSILILHEELQFMTIAAAIIMAIAVVVLLTEEHSHMHPHNELVHEHRHIYDEHHEHLHNGSEGEEPHSHLHTHKIFAHAHLHAPDLHHRHPH